MSVNGRNATTEVRDDAIVGWDLLVATLEAHWPWTDIPAVRASLHSWARAYYRDRPEDLGWRIDRVPHSDPHSDVAAHRARPAPDELALQDVAEELARIGTAADASDPEGIAWVVLLMVRNVAAGRDVLDYGELEHFGGFSARTIRSYRKRFGSDAADKLWAKIQRDIDIDIMVRRGWKPDSARVWLKREEHRRGRFGTEDGAPHANDAGDPRSARP